MWLFKILHLLWFVFQLLALKSCHDRNITHRDVKPGENIPVVSFLTFLNYISISQSSIFYDGVRMLNLVSVVYSLWNSIRVQSRNKNLWFVHVMTLMIFG